jgi:hypothetical protein
MDRHSSFSQKDRIQDQDGLRMRQKKRMAQPIEMAIGLNERTHSS